LFGQPTQVMPSASTNPATRMEAFVAIGALLVTSAVLMAALGRETAGPRRAVVEGELARRL